MDQNKLAENLLKTRGEMAFAELCDELGGIMRMVFLTKHKADLKAFLSDNPDKFLLNEENNTWKWIGEKEAEKKRMIQTVGKLEDATSGMVRKSFDSTVKLVSNDFRVELKYDRIARPNNKNTMDACYAYYYGKKLCGCIYLKDGPTNKYASFETVDGLFDPGKFDLSVFSKYQDRKGAKNVFRHKLFFTDYDRVESEIMKIMEYIKGVLK